MILKQAKCLMGKNCSLVVVLYATSEGVTAGVLACREVIVLVRRREVMVAGGTWIVNDRKIKWKNYSLSCEHTAAPKLRLSLKTVVFSGVQMWREES